MQSSTSVVPQGFSKYYMLSLLKERPMTGKEIMEETTRRTNGALKPSPGLVYPLLGKLLSSGCIEEVEEGRGYNITKKGEELLIRMGQRSDELNSLLTSVTRVGLFGELVARDAVDGMTKAMKDVRQDLSKLCASQKARYRRFLQSELERLDRSEKESHPMN